MAAPIDPLASTRRTVVNRTIEILVELRPGAFPDVAQPYGAKFEPHHLCASYANRRSGPRGA